jgi:hypothetical protein
MSERTYFGHTGIEANADLDALWAALLAQTCNADGSAVQTRYLAYPFDDGSNVLGVDTRRQLYLENPYQILGWVVEAFDADGLPTPIDCDFTVTIQKWDGSTVDPVGAGTRPVLAAASKNRAYPSDWATPLGDAQDTIIPRLNTLNPGVAVALLLTLIVQDRVVA